MKIFKLTLLFCWAFLLCSNVFGLFDDNKIPQKIRDTKFHKIGLNFEDREKVRNELRELTFNDMNADQVIDLNRLFAGSIVHYWPSYNYFHFTENWIIFSLQRFEILVNSKNKYFGKHERVSWEKVIESGFGLCSQVSIALYDFLVQKNQKASIIGLNGHVVVGASINKESYILDPDYDVVLKGDLSYIQKRPQLIKDAYSSRGYDEQLVSDIVKLYISTYDNSENTLLEYYPKYVLFYYLTEILKWLLPLFFIIALAIITFKREGKSYVVK